MTRYLFNIGHKLFVHGGNRGRDERRVSDLISAQGKGLGPREIRGRDERISFCPGMKGCCQGRVRLEPKD